MIATATGLAARAVAPKMAVAPEVTDVTLTPTVAEAAIGLVVVPTATTTKEVEPEAPPRAGVKVSPAVLPLTIVTLAGTLAAEPHQLRAATNVVVSSVLFIDLAFPVKVLSEIFC